MSPTSTRRFDAVLFDFGGVFIDSPFEALHGAARRRGLDPDAVSEVVFGSYETDTDHPWHRLERGQLTFAEARAEILEIGRAAGLGELDPMEVLAEMGAASRSPREFMVEVVREVRVAGHRTGVITNNIAEFGDYWRAIIPLDQLFDDVVDSSEVQLRKPDPAIYELACRRLGVEPDRALFVDDHPGNVAGAEAAGLVAICCGFTRHESEVAARQLLELVAG